MGVTKEHRLCFTGTYRNWMDENQELIQDYIDRNVDQYSIEGRDGIRQIFFDNPFICFVVVSDFIDNNKDIDANRIKFENFILREGNEFTMISGSRRSGKTGFAISTVENMYKRFGDFNKVYIGAPNKELESHGWEIVPSIEDMGKDDYGVQDELALFANSRRSQSEYNVGMLESMPTFSHTDSRGVMMLTQSTKRSDVGILDWANAHVIKNYTDAYSMNVERGIISDDLLLELLKPRENYVMESSIKSWSYIKTDKFTCLVYTPLVEWYSDKVGKAFARFKNDEEALEVGKAMIAEGYNISYVQKACKVRGFNEPKEYWKEIKNSGDNPTKKSVGKLKGIKGLLDDDETQAYIKSLKR